ncbi:GNAT family N-acetyltransferase [Teichococcus oryzae]|uniref:GNAT family N-acetyltransferase n=1 Tax=Teichococcus oryzae TaxID=1608942 RepID=UPI001F4FC956|nr:GNAT family N-acetyltransferase [Pseudoroseomonas oryzae]
MHELRAALPADAEALAILHAASFPAAERWGADAIRLMLEMPGAFGLLSARLGFILCRVVVDEAEVLTLAVRPEARRMGLGAALLGGALGLAAARGGARMFLEVSAKNAAAQALYAAAGFSVVGRRRRYYADGSDALVLSRDCKA